MSTLTISAAAHSITKAAHRCPRGAGESLSAGTAAPEDRTTGTPIVTVDVLPPGSRAAAGCIGRATSAPAPGLLVPQRYPRCACGETGVADSLHGSRRDPQCSTRSAPATADALSGTLTRAGRQDHPGGGAGHRAGDHRPRRAPMRCPCTVSSPRSTVTQIATCATATWPAPLARPEPPWPSAPEPSPARRRSGWSWPRSPASGRSWPRSSAACTMRRYARKKPSPRRHHPCRPHPARLGQHGPSAPRRPWHHDGREAVPRRPRRHAQRVGLRPHLARRPPGSARPGPGRHCARPPPADRRRP